MSGLVLSVRDLVVRPRWGGRPVVNGVSLSVRPGEVLALIGASGSGKTTVALAALGHLRPGLVVQSGEVRLGKVEMLSARPGLLRALRGRRIAYVAQSAAAAFNLRMRLDAQVTEVSHVHGTRPRDEALRQAHSLYRRLDLPEPETIGRRYPHEVSGGQLQRFMIAMGLQEHPELLVCDEPTSALDVTTQVEVLCALKRGIEEHGTAALFVSHDLAVVAQIADRIAVLRHGELMEEGTTRDILQSPRSDYTRALLAACRHLAPAGSGPIRRATQPVNAVLEVEQVVAGYGGRSTEGHPAITVLHETDLSVQSGQIVAVIGESGSGKSTLARVIAGMHPAASGRVRLGGRVLAPDVMARSIDERRKIQLVFQTADTALNQRHTVGRILGRVLTFFGRVPNAGRAARVAELLDMVQLPADYARRRPIELSGGEKQRVNLARALAADPEVLICDEITSALDTIVAASIIRLIEDLRERLRLAIVFISHDLATVASLADEVAVLRHGRLVERGATRAVLENPSDAYTRLLVSSVPELRIGWLEEAVAARDRLRSALTLEERPLELVASPVLLGVAGDVAR